MRRVSNQTAFLCLILAVIQICTASGVFAQAPKQNPNNADPAPAPNAPRPDNEEELKQGSLRSLMLTRRQSVIQCMDLIHEAFGRKDYLAAIPLMERILAEPNSFVPIDAATEIAAHEEVHRLAAQIPSELRKRLDEQRASIAARQWEQLRSSGTDELLSFLRQSFDLPIAVEAWWRLGLHERDHGRHQMAAAAFLNVADHPQSTNQQQLVALVAAYDTLSDAGRQSDLEPIRQRIAQSNPGQEILLADRTVRVTQWLAEHPSHRQTQEPVDPQAMLVQSRSRRPVVLPIWKHSFHSFMAASQPAREQRQRELGVKPVPILRPTMIGDHVVARNLDAVYAFSQATGSSRKICDNVEYRDLEGYFDRSTNQNAVIDWVQRRTQADSIFARISTDGQRIFVVQEPDRVREFGVDRPSIRGGFRSGPRFNKLCAYSLIDEEYHWEIGGNLADTGSPYRGDFFLGCPFVLDDELFAVVQRETEVILHAIDRTNGALLWSLTLGDVLLPVTEDLQRSRVACPIIWSDGRLIVSTGAGAVVAVDPVLRTLYWGYRYPARTIAAGDLLQGQNPNEAHAMQESWWDSWREPFLQSVPISAPSAQNTRVVASGSRSTSLLIFASPETDQLHAIRLPEGEPVWHVPRNGGLLIAGIIDNLIIVIEGDFARAHDLETGRQVWRTPTADISGPGVLSGAVLVLPLLSGGTMLVDATTGQTIADTANAGVPLGSLTETDRGWIAFNRQTIMLLPRLSDVRNDVTRELQQTPDSEALRVRAAFLDLQAGDFAAARGRLEGLKTTPALDLRRQALIDALRDLGKRGSSAERSELAQQLKDLAEGPDYRFTAAMAISSSALSVKDYPAAIEAALDGLSANLDQTEGLVKSDAAVVRKDRILIGLIDEAYRRCGANERPALDEIFDQRLKQAVKSRSKSALPQLSLQWRGMDWGRYVVVTHGDKALRNNSPSEIELRLLDAAGSGDREIGKRALVQLAERFERANAAQDAYAIRRRIRNEFAAINPQDAAQVPNTSDNGSLVANPPADRPKPVWPRHEPYWESIDEVRFSFYTLIPMHAEPGSLVDRLDVWLERSGNEILFRGDKFFQAGQEENAERKFLLPSSMSPHRGQTGFMLRGGWGIGRIVILLVGSELFAISPLDEEGRPNSQFLWPSSIELGPPPTNSRILKGHSTVNSGFEFMVDQSSRQIGKVGPVRAGYFCYQKGSKLIAAETQNGNVLWERLELPADAVVLGDDHFVYLWRNNNRLELLSTIEVLSTIDGRKLEERVWNMHPGSLLHHQGSLAWTATRGNDHRLELYDLRTGQLIWNRTDPKNSTTAVLDSETIAVATPNAKLNLLQARTGKLLCPPITINPKSVGRMLTWSDPDRWFIAMGGPNDVQPFKSANQLESYRRMQVRGTLYCIDRYEPRLLWQRDMKDEQVALDQSRMSPVIVQLWKKAQPVNSNTVDAILKVTDKLTGKLLPIKPKADLENYFLLNPDLEQAIVELRLKYETIRIHYVPEPPVDALDAVETNVGRGKE